MPGDGTERFLNREGGETMPTFPVDQFNGAAFPQYSPGL